jgi:hypothetical protein
VNYHEYIKDYVYQDLDTRLTSGNAPDRINVSTDFRRYCNDRNGKTLVIDEIIESQKNNLVSCLVDYMRVWEGFYLPSPVDFVGKYGETLITYKHARFGEETGRPTLPESYGEVHDWIGKQSEREFLFVCACELAFMGASAIYITDKSGDEGVDLIAKFESSPLSGLTLFVQAKTSFDLIGRDQMLTEYGKYKVGRNSPMFSTYLEALKIYESGCGHGPVYCFMANTGFKENTKIVARSLGILLRGRKQLAFSLASRYGMSKISSLRFLLPHLNADLKRNLAELIK